MLCHENQVPRRQLSGRLRWDHAGRVWLAALSRLVSAATDPELVEAAQRLLTLVDETGARAGRYTIDMRGAQGVQVGDHNLQSNVFSAPPDE